MGTMSRVISKATACSLQQFATRMLDFVIKTVVSEEEIKTQPENRYSLNLRFLIFIQLNVLCWDT